VDSVVAQEEVGLVQALVAHVTLVVSPAVNGDGCLLQALRVLVALRVRPVHLHHAVVLPEVRLVHDDRVGLEQVALQVVLARERVVAHAAHVVLLPLQGHARLVDGVHALPVALRVIGAREGLAANVARRLTVVHPGSVDGAHVPLHVIAARERPSALLARVFGARAHVVLRVRADHRTHA